MFTRVPRTLLVPSSSPALISRLLPPEVISDIFLRLALYYYTQYCDGLRRAKARHGRPQAPPSYVSSAYTWIRVAHVCRHWRAIALGSPRMWALISNKRLDCLDTFMQRSGKVPLTFGPHHEDDQHVGHIAETLLREANRLRVIELQVPLPPTFPLWRLLGDAKCLEELHYDAALSLLGAEQTFGRPLALSRLRELTLTMVPFPFLSALTKQAPLTKLVIGVSSNQSLTEWANLLGQFDALEELQLKGWLTNILENVLIHT